MSVLSDIEIIERVKKDGMISPFIDRQEKRDKQGKPIISYGLSSYGYDTRVADEFKIFQETTGAIVDPKNFKDNLYISKKENFCIIPANGFVLARTVEYF